MTKRLVVALVAMVMGVVGLAALTSTSSVAAAPTAAEVNGPTQWKSVSNAGYATCGIDVNQKLWCWGYNGYGQLGTGQTDGEDHPVPTQVGDDDWLSVRVSYYAVCGVKADHTGYCWGDDEYDVTGTNNASDSEYLASPTKVFGSVQWARIAPGYYNSCGISTTDKLYCWGYDLEGSVGDGPGDTSTPKPRRIGTASDWKSVTVGYYQSCAVNAGAQGFCWGSNDYGQVGDGTTENAFAPTRVAGTWKSINTVADTTCGVTTRNVSKCWGYNGDGQNGDGTTTNNNVPTTFAQQSGAFRRVLPGYYATCALTSSDSSVKCVGYNGYGQFGDGTYDNSSTLVPGAGDKAGWKQLAVGDYTTCGVRTNGKAFCWGYNDEGEAGVDGGESYLPSPVQVGTTTEGPLERRGSKAAPTERPVDHGPKDHRR